MNSASLFRPGEWVEVKSPEEIAQTLDDQGMLDGLPFMPEMIPFCGKSFRISQKVEKTCVENVPISIRAFRVNDVYLLDELRCDGSGHGGCDRYCIAFWRAQWLKPSSAAAAPTVPSVKGADLLRKKLVTQRSDGRYLCQSTELARITDPLSVPQRLGKCVREAALGNMGWGRMAKLILNGLYRKALQKKPREQQLIAGPHLKTPTLSLNLQPGDWVRVKPFRDIVATLDPEGRNRGLRYGKSLDVFSEKTFQVVRKVDRIIIEGSGEVKSMQDTVILDGINCTCANAVGGCPRKDPAYWREIWLEKLPAP